MAQPVKPIRIILGPLHKFLTYWMKLFNPLVYYKFVVPDPVLNGSSFIVRKCLQFIHKSTQLTACKLESLKKRNNFRMFARKSTSCKSINLFGFTKNIFRVIQKP